MSEEVSMAGGSGHKSKKCEEAKGTDCTCGCVGALHRSWILRVAVVGRNLDNEPPDTELWPATKFDRELTDIFGSAFNSVTAPLGPSEQVRASRRTKGNGGWPTVAGVKPAVHQVEKRVVDVALRELLRNVFALGLEAKPRWIQAVNALTLKKPEGQHLVLAGKLGDLPDPNSEGTKMSARLGADRKRDKDSYFWSSMLAALCSDSTTAVRDERTSGDRREVLTAVFTEVFDVLPVDGSVSEEQRAEHEQARAAAVSRLALAIQAATVDEVFSAVRYPRKTELAQIAYMMTPGELGVADPSVPLAGVMAAAEQLAQAVQNASDAGVSAADCLFVARTIGAASSLDLWDHPAAVRYLLVPAITEVRQRHTESGTTAKFSLDTVDEDIEFLIYTKLALPWHSGQNWGKAPDWRVQAMMDRLPAAEKKLLQSRARRTESQNVNDHKIAALQAVVETLQQEIKAITDRLNRLEG